MSLRGTRGLAFELEAIEKGFGFGKAIEASGDGARSSRLLAMSESSQPSASEPNRSPSAVQVELEMKLGFLEHTIEELNEVILDQNNAIEKLAKRIEKLEQRTTASADSQPEPSDPYAERPPHY